MRKTIQQRLEEKSVPVTESGCILWLGAIPRCGYGQMGVDGKGLYVHRLAWEEEYGSVPTGMRVLHKCDVSACINPKHLYLGTHAENMSDMVAKGRYGTPKVRLSDSQVRDIRDDQRSRASIADEYGVHIMTISRIKSFKQRAGA